MTFARASLYAFVVLAVVSWGYILLATDSGASDVVSAKTWSNAGNFVRQLSGVDTPARPAFLEADRWLATGRLALNTLAMSVLAIVLTGIAVLPTFLPGARNISNGDLGGAPSRSGAVLYHVVRLVFTLTRAVPELIWAMVIIFFLSPGILPGAVALAVHNYGVVGRLSAEVVENLEPGPARALRAAGREQPSDAALQHLPPSPPPLPDISALPVGGYYPDHGCGGFCQRGWVGPGVPVELKLLPLHRLGFVDYVVPDSGFSRGSVERMAPAGNDKGRVKVVVHRLE